MPGRKLSTLFGNNKKLLCYDGTKIKKYIETAAEARLFCNFTKVFTSKF